RRALHDADVRQHDPDPFGQDATGGRADHHQRHPHGSLSLQLAADPVGGRALMATIASHGHPPTTTGLDHRKIAIWAFIGSECMLFTSLISTYLVYKGRSVVGPFPHEACNPPQCATALKPILNIPVTSASTFVLLMSSLAMVLALAAVENKDQPGWARKITSMNWFANIL